MSFFKTKENVYDVANKVWPFQALPELFICSVSLLSDVLGVEELIRFILLVCYCHSHAPPLSLQ